MSLKMGLLGRKIGMTQVFHDDGSALGCTAVSVGPCVVVAKRTVDKHGYSAVQLAFGAAKRATKPLAGHFVKSGVAPARHLIELRLDDAGRYDGRSRP